MFSSKGVNCVDVWSYVHFFGSMFIVFMLHLVFKDLHIWYCFTISVLLGFIWEYFDFLTAKHYQKYGFVSDKFEKIIYKIFDIRGFSTTDLIIDTLGSGLMIIIFLIL